MSVTVNDDYPRGFSYHSLFYLCVV